MKIAPICIVLFIYLSETLTFAQNPSTVPIPDPGFRSYVDSFYTFLLDPGTKELKVAEAANLTGAFYLVRRNIKSLEGIQYFKGLTELYCNHNQLTELPDLSPITNLTKLHCYENQLTKLPSLNKLSQLQDLSAFDNRLVEFPAIDSLKNIKELIIFRNQLTSIPDLTYLSQLERLDCYENKLTSIGKQPASLKIFLFGDNLLANFPDISLAKGVQHVSGYTNHLTTIPDLGSYQSLTILNLGNNKIRSVPASISSMTWLTTLVLDNNQLHDLPELSALTQLKSCRIDYNFLTFDDLTAPSANPNFKDWRVVPQDSLEIPKITTPIERQKVRISLAEADSSSNLQYDWYHNGELKSTTNKPFLDFTSIQKTDNGKYYCRVTSTAPALDSLDLFSNTFEILVAPNFSAEENLCITPNGDGKNDEMYFSEQGTMLVYDSQGRLLDQLQSPCYWNGSTRNGKELGTGFYFIEINKTTTYPVTIIR